MSSAIEWVRRASTDEQEREVSTRRHFLRRLGTTLAAGAGLAIFPASQAQAACSTCCPDTSCPPGCGGSGSRYRCQPGNCCICHRDIGCFSTQQCQC